MWRAISGALAVSDRLQYRGLNVDNVCKLCQQNSETICHVLFHCSAAQILMEIANITTPVNGFGNSVEQNLSYLLDLAENAGIAEDVRISFPWYYGPYGKTEMQFYIRVNKKRMKH